MTPGPCPGITSVDQARGRLSVAWNGGNQVGLMPEGEYAPTPPPPRQAQDCCDRGAARLRQEEL